MGVKIIRKGEKYEMKMEKKMERKKSGVGREVGMLKNEDDLSSANPFCPFPSTAQFFLILFLKKNYF